MKLSVAVVAVPLLVLGATAFAQEHPEHPEDKTETSAQEMTLDELAAAISAYIAQDARLKGGYFLVYDPVDKKPLMLRLEKVHKDRLSALGGGVYFACTDMKAPDETVYDLDFFMKRTGDRIATTEVAIHKKAGKPRYGWKEEDGVWKKVVN